ncbi:acyltransferase family protein [Polyangium fumosum]|uniref:Acyltransferase n=1 Tax=Polyangium fumosum TaxID=889272 RepID=A0A4U1J1X1_9BACT|nr:acyltransferase family protein [Polyangium fumosum]TKD01056.1 acyltransferase [Polyangium fumosum]
MKPEQSPTYRPEIDGLRAIAVTSVVLFHADLGLAGGYVGVDVFFVISGFLITSLILRDLRNDTFRLADFWERRARRILPALVPASAAALLLSIAFLPPDALEGVGRSAMYLAAFASNVFYRNNLGYFSARAEEQPLLHTWSLAVEEQFYLLFPPLLLLAFRLVKRSHLRLALVLGITAALSLAASIRITRIDPPSAFYLLPARAFELLAGALLAFVPAKPLARLGHARELLSIGGLTLIAACSLLFTRETPFPGVAAAAPCLGALLFLLANLRSVAGPPPTWSGLALASRPFVFLGLVSYSFYLWHWPPLAIAHSWKVGGDAWLFRSAVVLGAFVLAVLSWRFVEQPFRKPRPRRSRAWVGVGTAVAMGALLLGGASISAHGEISQVPPAALGWLDAKIDPKYLHIVGLDRMRARNLPSIGVRDEDKDPTVLVWGDSHAMAVMSAIDEACRDVGWKGLVATHASTAPVRGYYVRETYGLNERALPYSESLFELIPTAGITDVVLVAYWSSYFREDPPSHDPLVKALLLTIKDLRALGVRVWFQREVPKYAVDVPQELARRALVGLAPPSGEVTLAELHVPSPMQAFESEIVAAGATLVDSIGALSTTEGLPIAGVDGRSLYCDHHHLTPAGARRLLPAYRAAFAAATQP